MYGYWKSVCLQMTTILNSSKGILGLDIPTQSVQIRFKKKRVVFYFYLWWQTVAKIYFKN